MKKKLQEPSNAALAPRIAAVSPDSAEEWPEALTKTLGGAQVPNLFATVARNPDLFAAWLPLCLYQLQSPEFSARQRELVIMRTARLCRARYVWGHHVGFARQAGISDDEITRLGANRLDDRWPGEDRSLLHAVEDLHTTHTINTDTWIALTSFLSVTALIGLPMLVGHYTLLANLLNSLGSAVDESVPAADQVIGWGQPEMKEDNQCVSQ